MQGLFPAFARFPVYLWVPARFFADFCIAWQIKKLEWSVTFFWSIFKQGGALAKNRGVFSLRSRIFLFRGMQGNSAPPLGAPSLTNGAPGSANHRGAPEAGPGTQSAPSLTLTPHPPWRRTLLRLRVPFAISRFFRDVSRFFAIVQNCRIWPWSSDRNVQKSRVLRPGP